MNYENLAQVVDDVSLTEDVPTMAALFDAEEIWVDSPDQDDKIKGFLFPDNSALINNGIDGWYIRAEDCQNSCWSASGCECHDFLNKCAKELEELSSKNIELREKTRSEAIKIIEKRIGQFGGKIKFYTPKINFDSLPAWYDKDYSCREEIEAFRKQYLTNCRVFECQKLDETRCSYNGLRYRIADTTGAISKKAYERLIAENDLRFWYNLFYAKSCREFDIEYTFCRRG